MNLLDSVVVEWLQSARDKVRGLPKGVFQYRCGSRNHASEKTKRACCGARAGCGMCSVLHCDALEPNLHNHMSTHTLPRHTPAAAVSSRAHWRALPTSRPSSRSAPCGLPAGWRPQPPPPRPSARWRVGRSRAVPRATAARPLAPARTGPAARASHRHRWLHLSQRAPSHVEPW